MSTTTFPPTCQQVATDARAKGLWIYDPTQKKWYSPEEFHNKFGRITTGYENFFAQVQIRDPHDGIKAGFLQIQNMQTKLEDLNARVITYYRTKQAAK